jgi:archaellum biogenesis protein FlaJ (TadC family)
LNRMDEYNSGWDPEVRRYFRKIINSFSMGLLWMLTSATAGLYFDLAKVGDGWKWYNVLYYVLFLAGLSGLLFYLYRTWSKKD